MAQHFSCARIQKTYWFDGSEQDLKNTQLSFFNIFCFAYQADLMRVISTRKKRMVKTSKTICPESEIFYFCARVSPVRPAPVEFPQGLTAARVDGCSGAMR